MSNKNTGINVNNTQMEDVMSNKDTLVKLIVLSYILPESKVKGTDMFGRETIRGTLKSLEMKILDARAEMSAEDVQEAQELANDQIRALIDDEEGLNTNRMVDDLASRFEAIEKEDKDLNTAFKNHLSVIRSVYSVADEAQQRHERMATRLAIMDHLKKIGQTERAEDLNDNAVERVMAGEAQFDESLKAFVVDRKAVRAKEREILLKNNAVYFRLLLEHKANVLITMSYEAERLKKKTFRTQEDFEYIQMVIKHAKRVEEWCKAREKRPKPYSKRAIWALYNEAVDTLHALGVYKETFYRTEFGTKDPCSFRVVPTASTMVEVKSGSDWSDEIRAVFYEADDGTGRVPVRGSGD